MIGEEKILLVGFITSFMTVLLSTPALIKVANLKKLYDEPGEVRKQHKESIPSIGGIIIFAATLFSYSLWFPIESNSEGGLIASDLKYIVSTLLVLFFDVIIVIRAIEVCWHSTLLASRMILLALPR